MDTDSFDFKKAFSPINPEDYAGTSTLSFTPEKHGSAERLGLLFTNPVTRDAPMGLVPYNEFYATQFKGVAWGKVALINTVKTYTAAVFTSSLTLKLLQTQAATAQAAYDQCREQGYTVALLVEGAVKQVEGF